MESKIISSHVYFYKNGMNKRNWAYNLTSHTAILAASLIGSDTGYTLARPLALGAPFELSPADYFTVKEATYIKIINQIQSGASVTFETRCAFIDSFTWLTVGTVTVNYTLDDWYNFFLSGDYPQSALDGFVTRANISLIDSQNIIDLYNCMGSHVEIENIEEAQELEKDLNYGTTLPSGWKCYAVFYDTPYFMGDEVSGDSSNSNVNAYSYFSLDDLGAETVDGNAIIGMLITSKSGLPQAVYYGSFGAGNILMNFATPAGFNDSHILKVIEYQGYAPFTGFSIRKTSSGTNYILIQEESGVSISDYRKKHCANVYTITNGTELGNTYSLLKLKYSPIARSNFSTLKHGNGETYTKKTTYYEYLNDSLYKLSPEFLNIVIKYRGAEISTSLKNLRKNSLAYCYYGETADGESSYIKLRNQNIDFSDYNTAFGANTMIEAPLVSFDYQGYKNAKISGALGIGINTLQLVATTAQTFAGGGVNPTAAITAAGSAGGLVQNITEYKGIRKNTYNNNVLDISAERMANKENLLVIYQKPNSKNENIVAIDLERNGIGCYIDINTYLNSQQMQAYNAVKTGDLDVHGVPDNVAKNIKFAFENGVTLWTATNVGNKDVINYPIAQSIEL